ncbi:hypothetical protein ACLOJK_016218 [Asimina triloba]
MVTQREINKMGLGAAPHDEESSLMIAMRLADLICLPMALKAALDLKAFEIIAAAGPHAHLTPQEMAAKMPPPTHMRPRPWTESSASSSPTQSSPCPPPHPPPTNTHMASPSNLASYCPTASGKSHGGWSVLPQGSCARGWAGSLPQGPWDGFLCICFQRARVRQGVP